MTLKETDNDQKRETETHSKCGAATHSTHMIEAYARALVIWCTAGHESSLDHTLWGFGERERPSNLQMNAIITAPIQYISY